jgi:hypothetical protein
LKKHIFQNGTFGTGVTTRPKPDGRQRPLAITALEDKIVQRATVAVLNAIYEEDFLGLTKQLKSCLRCLRVVRKTQGRRSVPVND